MTPDELRVELERLKVGVVSKTTKVNDLDTEVKATYESEREIRESVQKAIEAQRQKRLEAEQAKFYAQSAINQDKQRIREIEALLQAKEAEEAKAAKAAELKAERAALGEHWNALTAGAYWREFAKEHQIVGGQYLTEHRKVILADVMGLGKTLTSIATVDMVEAATKNASPEMPFLGEVEERYNYETGEYELQVVNGVERPVGRKILYFCPASLILNVMDEFRLWASHRNVTFVGGMTRNERRFIFDFVLPSSDAWVVICNYEAWRRDTKMLDEFIALNPDTVIMDEAHAVKDLASIAYKGVKRIIDEAKPEYVFPMTGTPILNRPQELFSLLSLVNSERFHHLNDFLYEFCEQNEDGKWIFQDGGLDRVAKKIRTNYLRRTKDDAGVKLPEKTITIHNLEVDEEAYPEQSRIRKEMKENAMLTLQAAEDEGKVVGAAAMIAMYTRLRQIETWPAGIHIKESFNEEGILIPAFDVDIEESQKVDYVISSKPDEFGNWSGLIPEAIEDERVVLFSQFKAPLEEIARRLKLAGYRPVILDGSTSNEERRSISQDFDLRHTPLRENSKYDVALCNYRVGGVGLNLTAATQLIALDEEWNPGKRDQAYDRIHRIGQTKPVTIHVVRNAKTIDDWLAGIMKQKEDLVDGFDTAMASAKEFMEALDSGLI